MKQGTASGTARLIAAATILRGHAGSPQQQGPPGAALWCRRFLSTCRADRVLRWSVGTTVGRALWSVLERWLLPQIVSHWMARKREIDRLTRQASSDGYTQLVVLGAGLDTLAFRLAEDQVFQRVISADHPDTLAVVRAATAGVTPSRVELVPLDLADAHAVQAFAHSPAVDPSRPTLVVIEGVLMYLDEPAVAGLLRTLAARMNGRSRLIATVMATEAKQSPGFAGQSTLIDAWLSHRREPMLWGCDPAALPAYLAHLGWAGARVSLVSGEGRGDMEQPTSLASERLIVAELGPGTRPATEL